MSGARKIQGYAQTNLHITKLRMSAVITSKNPDEGRTKATVARRRAPQIRMRCILGVYRRCAQW